MSRPGEGRALINSQALYQLSYRGIVCSITYLSRGHGAPPSKTRPVAGAPAEMGTPRRGIAVPLMSTAMKLIRLGLLIGAIVTTAATCAMNGAVPPPGSPTTLMYGWEHHFSIDWTAVEQTGNTRRVSGYVQSHHGEFATHLRVLAQGIDTSGAVVGQRIAYVPGGVGGFGRAYFIVPGLPIADSYRVSVWDYAWNQAPGNRIP